MKKLLLISFMLAVSPLALADSKIAGTFRNDIKTHVGRGDPIVAVVISIDKALHVEELMLSGRKIAYDCESASGCKSGEIQVSWDKGDIVVNADHSGDISKMRRYHVSEEGKVLTMTMFGGGGVGTNFEFQRAD